jgi:hypothetical protein
MGEVVDLFNKKKVSARCMSCGDVHTRIVDGDAWNWYINSKRLVQDLFPDEDERDTHCRSLRLRYTGQVQSVYV